MTIPNVICTVTPTVTHPTEANATIAVTVLNTTGKETKKTIMPTLPTKHTISTSPSASSTPSTISTKYK